MHSPLTDASGRRITYLRVSLTDLCNFRCVYCVPPEGLPKPASGAVLTRQEILRFVRVAGAMGVHRVRLTGGEPLLRTDIVDIVRALKQVETVRDLSLTTNGSRLAPLLHPLKEAGLDRINISLDSLNPERFAKITGSSAYDKVLEATFSALRAGFPVKLNMVAMQGLTVQEIVAFVGLARDYPLEVRFLEFMPLCGTGWGADRFMSVGQVRAIVQEHFELSRRGRKGDAVAESYDVVGGKGSVGFIGSLTESFCDTCSRMRLSADGQVYPCLFSDAKVSVRDLLRQEAPDEEIAAAIRQAAAIKPRGNWFVDKPYRQGDEGQFAFEPSPLIHNIGG